VGNDPKRKNRRYISNRKRRADNLTKYLIFCGKNLTTFPEEVYSGPSIHQIKPSISLNIHVPKTIVNTVFFHSRCPQQLEERRNRVRLSASTTEGDLGHVLPISTPTAETATNGGVLGPVLPISTPTAKTAIRSQVNRSR
jgi:hypothetical protein